MLPLVSSKLRSMSLLTRNITFRYLLLYEKVFHCACSIIDGRSIVVNTTPADCIAMGDSCKVI